MKAIALITAIGAALRLAVADQPLFADELATFWIVTDNDFGGVVSTVHSNAEITPPLYFILSWAATQISTAPELVRGPSLVAGVATIPLVYTLGTRTVGRPAALVASALTALSPFMVYYSAEARAYGLMMALVVLSTLALLRAIETRRATWWALYAACSVAAVYSHYTSVFVLAAQFGWALWAAPHARRAVTLANVGAAVCFLPWITGVRNDFNSPTSAILDALSPFTFEDIRISVEHWTVGYPYSYLPLRQLPGLVALVLIAVALVGAAAALTLRLARAAKPARLSDLDSRLVLVVAMAASVPLGELIASALSTNLFTTRNLAAAWPALALCMGALLMAAGPRLRVALAVLALAGFAIGAGRMLQEANQRPDYQAAANYVDGRAGPRDTVVDTTAALSPGPLSPLDVTLRRPHRVLRAGAPAVRDRPFALFDRFIPLSEALNRAALTVRGGRVLLVLAIPPDLPAFAERRRILDAQGYPAGYRRTARRTYRGFLDVRVDTLERPKR